MKYNAVIIGSGISGLTTALILAKHGLKTAIIEKAPHIAPLLSRFQREGHWCDIGFHYSGGLNPDGNLSVLFRYLGIADKLNPIHLNPDAFDICVLNGLDKEINIPVGYKRIEEAFNHHFPKSRNAIREYLNKLIETQNNTPFISFNFSADDILEPDHTDLISLSQFIKKHNGEDNFIKFLDDYGYYLYGVKADEVPIFIHALTFGSFYKSAHTFARGGDEIVDAYKQKLNDAGVDIFCSNEVVNINISEHNKVKSVTLKNGKVIECKICISTIHPALLDRIINPKPEDNTFFSEIKSLQNTPSCFLIYLETNEIIPKTTNSNIYSINMSDNDLYHTASMVYMGDEYSNKKSLCIFSAMPKNLHSKNLCINSEKKYLEFKEIETEKILEQLYKTFPTLRGKIKVLETLTQFSFERWTATVDGSSYGIKNSIYQQKPPYKTSIKGLYLAGQNINTPGIMGAIISGFLVSCLLFGFKTIWEEICKFR